jgi:repressor of nif and glnA expression
MVFESQSVARKELAILRILSESPEPLGARVIAHNLKDYGFELGERAVRYHLKLLDERGLTYLVARRDGRNLTEKGTEELKSALVKDKVGFSISKIETLSFRTTFDIKTRRGLVPVNISFFNKDQFPRAFTTMKFAFKAGYCVSSLIAIVRGGQQLGEVTVPPEKIGLATACSIIFNGVLLKAGIPMDSRFGGILQVRNHKPVRFVELIDYTGCSLDPSTLFIKARMTSVREVVRTGDGHLLGNFREIPSICRSQVNEIIAGLSEAGIYQPVAVGEASEPVCEIPVEQNKIGIVLLGGLNPVAAAEEGANSTDNYAMSTVMDYQELVDIQDISI